MNNLFTKFKNTNFQGSTISPLNHRQSSIAQVKVGMPQNNLGAQPGYQITIRSGFIPRKNIPQPGEPIIGHSSVVLQSPAGVREYNVAVNDYNQIKGKPLRSLASGIPAAVERVSSPIALNQAAQTSIPISPGQYGLPPKN